MGYKLTGDMGYTSNWANALGKCVIDGTETEICEHRLDDRVEQAEKDQAEVVFLEQQALGAARTGLRFDCLGLNDSETPAEIA